MHDPSKYVGLCCQSVGISTIGSVNMLAKVALCDYWGQIIFVSYVQPQSEVTSYRTGVTGITAADLVGRTDVRPPRALQADSLPFATVQQRVAQIIHDKVLIGYCIYLDLSVLGLAHPNSHIRDVALFVPFRFTLGSPGAIVRFPTMMWVLMGRRVGELTHDPLEDARAATDLFRSVETQWEGYIDQLQWPCYLPPNAYASCFL